MNSFVPHSVNQNDAGMGLEPTHRSICRCAWPGILQLWELPISGGPCPCGQRVSHRGHDSVPRELGEDLVSLGPWGTTRHGLWAALGGISGPWLAPGSWFFRLAEEDLGPATQSAWSS